MPSTEILLYPHIMQWLQSYLTSKHPGKTVEVFDVHAVNLCDFFEMKVYKTLVPSYQTFRIKIDILGIIRTASRLEMCFVEVKDTQISLLNLSQLIGYTKIVQPEYAFLISPQGLSTPLHSLLHQYNRRDILRYNCEDAARIIKIAKWLPERHDIDYGSMTT